VKSGISPAHEVIGDFRGQHLAFDHQREQFKAEHLGHNADIPEGALFELGQGGVGIVNKTIGDNKVQVAVPVHRAGVSLHERDNARAHAFSKPAAGERLCERVVRGCNEQAQELSVPHKIRPQALGDREAPESVGDGEEEFFLNRLDPEQGSLLVAGWAELSCLAREWDGHVLPALGAFITGNALARVSAGQKSFNGMGDNRAEEAIVFRIEPVIALLKVAEMVIDDLEQRAFVKKAGPVSRVFLLHKNRAKQESCR